MNQELLSALQALEAERGLSAEVLVDALETALVHAYRKNYNGQYDVSVRMDAETGDFKVFARFVVVEAVTDPTHEVSLAEARELDPNYQTGDVVEKAVEPKD